MEKVEPKDRTWVQETKREGQIKRQIPKLFKKNYEEKGLTTLQIRIGRYDYKINLINFIYQMDEEELLEKCLGLRQIALRLRQREGKENKLMEVLDG